MLRVHTSHRRRIDLAGQGVGTLLNQPFGQALADESGRFTQVDRTLCEMLGFEMRALLQRSIHDITHPDDWPSNQPLLERLLAHDEPFTIVKRYLRADGTAVWVQNYVSVLRDAEGRRAISALIRPVLPPAGARVPQRKGGAAELPAPAGQASKPRHSGRFLH